MLDVILMVIEMVLFLTVGSSYMAMLLRGELDTAVSIVGGVILLLLGVSFMVMYVRGDSIAFLAILGIVLMLILLFLILGGPHIVTSIRGKLNKN